MSTRHSWTMIVAVSVGIIFSCLMIGCENGGDDFNDSQPSSTQSENQNNADLGNNSEHDNQNSNKFGLDALTPYAGNYSGTVTTKSGEKWNVTFYLHSPFQGTGCYLFIRDDDVSLLGSPPQFVGNTLSFSDDYGVGQNYLVTIHFYSYQSSSLKAEKISGRESEHYPLSGSIVR